MRTRLDERTRLAALTVIGTFLLMVPAMYGVSRIPGPDGGLVFAIGGGPSLIAFGVVALVLGLGWATARFVPLPAAALVRVALVAFAIGLAIRAVGLTDWWVNLRTERVAAGQEWFQLWIDLPAILFSLAAPLIFAIVGAKRLRAALESPAVKSPRLR
jgi:hypothetical protein